MAHRLYSPQVLYEESSIQKGRVSRGRVNRPHACDSKRLAELAPWERRTHRLTSGASFPPRLILWRLWWSVQRGRMGARSEERRGVDEVVRSMRVADEALQPWPT